MPDIPDYSDALPESPRTEDLQQISTLVSQFLGVEEEIEELEVTLKQRKALKTKIEENDLPELMRKINMEKFTTGDGYGVTIKTIIRANIPEANKPKVFKWLKENGHGGIIKSILEISIAPGSEKKLQKLLGMKVMDQFPTRKLGGSVNVQTLKAFIKREKEKDPAFPMSKFNAVEIDQAKIKAPKKLKIK